MVSKRTDAGRLPVLVRWGRSVGRKASVTTRDYVAAAVRTSGTVRLVCAFSEMRVRSRCGTKGLRAQFEATGRRRRADCWARRRVCERIERSRGVYQAV